MMLLNLSYRQRFVENAASKSDLFLSWKSFRPVEPEGFQNKSVELQINENQTVMTNYLKLIGKLKNKSPHIKKHYL